MNCKNFEAVISDLAREQMLEAHAREDALLHVEECAGCAARLEDERALTSGLRSLAASMKQWEAPASLEANLLDRFREQRAAATAGPSSVVIQMPQKQARWQRWYPHAVAAAVVLMFAVGGASMLRMRQAEPEASRPEATASRESKSVKPVAPVSTEAPTAGSAQDEGETVETAGDAGDEGRGQKLSKKEVAAIMNTDSLRRPAYVPKSRVNRSGMTNAGGEIATDFMPVSYGDNLNEIENGRIIRVEMPRSALAQFGLPVNMERAGERVKADVLIGEDGMARAIRFVR